MSHVLRKLGVTHHVADDIAKRKDILQGFRLKLHVRDTKAINGLAGKLMFDLMENEEPKVAVIGPIKSASLEVTGQIAAAYNVIVLSFIALSSDIRNIELFPTLFKVNQDFSVLNPLRIKLMEYFGWKRAGIIAFDDDVTLPVRHFFSVS
ncbi:hypothetical protein DPMN_127045 [Dreissena polymorpha]|uniref:Receptor ligand binding region domain-containing protein n=1 Tax=Dreissena polymorpha TaxID=45954 RepID=A0A9D4JYH1_DREPO|nr:hypothetical protein DPMN_127045 [Dreissena polymorpha]